MRFLKQISIIAILQPTSINSQPQNLFELEDIHLASSSPSQAPSYILDTEAFDTNDDNVDFDSALATNTDPLNPDEKEPITAAANTGDTVALCQTENDQEAGTLNGRSALCKSPDLDMTIEWLQSNFDYPVGDNEFVRPVEMCVIINDSK